MCHGANQQSASCESLQDLQVLARVNSCLSEGFPDHVILLTIPQPLTRGIRPEIGETNFVKPTRIVRVYFFSPVTWSKWLGPLYHNIIVMMIIKSMTTPKPMAKMIIMMTTKMKVTTTVTTITIMIMIIRWKKWSGLTLCRRQWQWRQW